MIEIFILFIVLQCALRVVLPRFYSRCKETLFFFTTIHQPKVTSRSYGNYSDYCPPCTTHIFYLQRASF